MRADGSSFDTPKRDTSGAAQPVSEPNGHTTPSIEPEPAPQRQPPHPVSGDLPRSPSAYLRLIKPGLDRIIGLVLALVTLPILVIIVVVNLVAMGSPVMFNQPRVGRNGSLFTLLKFRTMTPDKRREQVPFVGFDRRKTHKSPNDPRLTASGRFLRRWSLDELPQFWNVVAGHMSLVGPRPELVDIVDGYEPWQHERHTVKPGITGPWQISLRGEVPMHEATELDIEYAQSVTFVGDMKLLLFTIPIVFGLRKGY